MGWQGGGAGVRLAAIFSGVKLPPMPPAPPPFPLTALSVKTHWR
jgi:hypothetical protein